MEDQAGQIDQSATKLGNPVVDKQLIFRKLERKFPLEQLPLPPGTTSIKPLLSLSKENNTQESASDPIVIPEEVTAMTDQLAAEAEMRTAVDTERSKAEQYVLSFFKDKITQEANLNNVKTVMGMIEKGDTANFDSLFQRLCRGNEQLQALATADPALMAHLREQFTREAILLYGSRDIPKDGSGKDKEDRFSKAELAGIVEWIGKEKIGAFITGNLEIAQQLLGDDFDPNGDVMEQIQNKLKEGSGGNIWRIILLLLGVTAVTMVSGARSVQM